MSVLVLTTGGTIASLPDPETGAKRPAVSGEELVAGVVGLAEVADVEVEEVAALSSWNLTPDHMLAVARRAGEALAQPDVDGVVVTHGTDTLEETAVLIDLLHGGDAPIVVTGAIRPASAAGADGPANLLDAVRAAGAAETAGLGVLVAFAGELHAARRVRKSDSVSPRAFSSPGAGPAGRVAEESVAAWSAPPRRPPLPVAHLDARVELAQAGLGTDGALVRELVAAGVDGVVAVLLGAGHAPPAFLAACRSAGERIPVVATVRPEAGRILRGTYGFEGAERDVRAAGLILAPACSPAAARMTLLACLGAGHSRVAMAGVFAADDP